MRRFVPIRPYLEEVGQEDAIGERKGQNFREQEPILKGQLLAIWDVVAEEKNRSELNLHCGLDTFKVFTPGNSDGDDDSAGGCVGGKFKFYSRSDEKDPVLSVGRVTLKRQDAIRQSKNESWSTTRRRRRNVAPETVQDDKVGGIDEDKGKEETQRHVNDLRLGAAAKKRPVLPPKPVLSKSHLERLALLRRRHQQQQNNEGLVELALQQQKEIYRPPLPPKPVLSKRQSERLALLQQQQQQQQQQQHEQQQQQQLNEGLLELTLQQLHGHNDSPLQNDLQQQQQLQQQQGHSEGHCEGRGKKSSTDNLRNVFGMLESAQVIRRRPNKGQSQGLDEGQKGHQPSSYTWRRSLAKWQLTLLVHSAAAMAAGYMFRLGYNSEEVAMTFGDSETESDDDDEDDDDDDVDEDDLENLDSVSVVAARTAANSSHAPVTPLSRVGVASSADLAACGGDSGRGESPESSCSSSGGSGGRGGVVMRRPRKPKPPIGSSAAGRPISAVPSEYSDVSTASSCGRSAAGSDDDLVIMAAAAPAAAGQSEAGAEATGQSEVVEAETDEKRMERVHRIASELLSTEEQYVDVLHLIDQVFRVRVDQENRLHHLFPADTMLQMFANINSIYLFHNDFLRPQLRERMDSWKTSPAEHQRIGDIFVKLTPFLKMYTDYVMNFGNAINVINSLYQKNSKFAVIMDDIHSMPECGKLSLQHHMLTPIQRIPRYEMLLKDYLRKLPEHSEDRADSEKALHFVSTAAKHANDAMRRIEKFKKLLEVQESLGGNSQVDLVSPTRELVKEGRIVKISARSGDHQDRYLFLFSDLLLLCSPRLLTNRVIPGSSGPTYRLRARFEVDSMQVLEGDNLVTANTFYIRDDHKSVELYTQTREEKEAWLEYLFETIKELYQRKSSLRVTAADRVMLRPTEAEIGRKQPHLLKLDSYHKCMECGQPFSMMRKKHNCRACGIVVCTKCSSQKYPLPFEESKTSRVCRGCFRLLEVNAAAAEAEAEAAALNEAAAVNDAAADASHEDDDADNADDATSSEALQQQQQQLSHLLNDAPVRPRGLLEVPANSPSILSGHLSLRTSSSSSSSLRYFALLPDFVLYTFRTPGDSRALTATPVPGYTVLYGPHELRGDALIAEKDKDKTIKMFVPQSARLAASASANTAATFGKVYYFLGQDRAQVERWAEALKLATRAETPSAKPASATSAASNTEDTEEKPTSDTKNSDSEDRKSTSSSEMDQ